MEVATTASPRGQSPASSSADSSQTLLVTLVDQTNVSTASARWTRILNIIRHSNAKAKNNVPAQQAQANDSSQAPASYWAAPNVASYLLFSGCVINIVPTADDPPPVVIRLNPPAGSCHAREADSRISQVTEFNPYIFPSGKPYVFPPSETPPELIPDRSKQCLNEDCPLNQANIAHNQGHYYHDSRPGVRGMFGVSNPPPDILEAWRRMFCRKRYSKADEDTVIPFVYFHSWKLDEAYEAHAEVCGWTEYTKDFYDALVGRVWKCKTRSMLEKMVWKIYRRGAYIYGNDV